MKWLVLIIILNFGWEVSGQIIDDRDSLTLDFRDYMDLVIDHHPLALSAELFRNKAAATTQMAKGGFDPKIEGTLDRKSFDDKNYFTVLGGKLKVPTWYGIELNAGYNRTSGDFLDNSNILPERGLWSAGISIPLGKGLVIDERRTALRQAEIYESLTEQQRILAYNQLLFESMNAYLEWQLDFQILTTFERGLQLTEERFRSTKQNYLQGDKPAIDTLEAYVNLQNRKNQVLESRRSLLESKQNLENYLWSEGIIPLELAENLRPQVMDNSFMIAERDNLWLNVEELINAHPDIQTYNLKIDGIELDQKLLQEDLKPDFRIQFNPLIGTNRNDLFLPYDVSNYKLGANFNYTFLQRKTKGKLNLNKAKLQDNILNIQAKKLEIQNNLDFLFENEKLYLDQLVTMREIVTDTEELLNAEMKKYAIGESSIFLINSRELKFIESRIKQIELINKALKNRMYLFYYSGRLSEMFL